MLLPRPVRRQMASVPIFITMILAIAWGQSGYTQPQMSEVEMAHRLGLSEGDSIDFYPLGSTRHSMHVPQRFVLDIDTPERMDIARSAQSNLSETVTRMFAQQRPPELRFYTRLNAQSAGSSRQTVSSFNGRDDVHEERPPRPRQELPRNASLTFFVSSADYSASSDTYPFVDEDMAQDCHQRLCMILVIDLRNSANLDIAIAQLDKVEEVWLRQDWSSALHREDQGYYESRRMSAYQTHLRHGLQVLPASNPNTDSTVLGLVIQLRGGVGVTSSYVAVGFIGQGSISP